MNQIIVGFSRPQSGFQPFSWLIRLMTWSPFSHTYIRFYSQTYQRWLVYQASGLAVNFVGKTMFDSKETICGEFAIPVSDQAVDSTVEYAIDKCGSPYGVGQVLGFACVLFMHIFGKTIHNPFYSGSSYVCSELVSDVLLEIGAADGIDPSSMSPMDVYKYLVSKGYPPPTP